MSTDVGSQATKAVEWMVEKLSVAASSGWWSEKLTALTTSAPAYLTGSAAAPAPAPAPSYSAPAPSGANSADVAAARDAAARAESTAQALAGRVAKLEDQLRQLRKAQEQLTVHVEEAVGPPGEGPHKAHWWSKK